MHNSEYLVNLDHFHAVTLNDVQFSKEILDRFLQQSSSYQNAFKQGITNKDFHGIKKTAQQLKSSALLFGAEEMVKNIKRIEGAHIEKMEEYLDTIFDIQNQLTQITAEISDVQKKF